MEVVGSVQFVGFSPLQLPDLVGIGDRLDGYQLMDVQPALPPMNEAGPGPAELSQFTFGFGQAQHRVLFTDHDGRGLAQVQADRIAINERRQNRGEAPPSSSVVIPQLRRLSEAVAPCFPETAEPTGPRAANLVELTYVNVIEPAEGVWASHADTAAVLTGWNRSVGESPYDVAESVGMRFSFPLNDDQQRFSGRVHVAVDPGYSEAGTPVLQVNIFSRRLVDSGSGSWVEKLNLCHEDVVTAFTAVTTTDMHNVWGRYQ